MIGSFKLQPVGKRYILHEQLGKGGMGVVYRALDRLTTENIALKQVTAPADQLLFESVSSSTNFRLALAQEFKTLASLRHPNIISVLDYGFDIERQPYFTMDWLENAQTICDAGRGRSLEVQLDLLSQMLQALAYLHRRGIVHRDLKPANVLVVAQLNQQTIKVLDFGLSVAHNDHSDDEQTDTIFGTLAYMSPELLQGDSASERSDLYAVGIIAFELFAGHHPFNVDKLTELMFDTQHTLPDVGLLKVPPAVAHIIERLLAKTPADRYSSATEVLKAFSAATQQTLIYETIATRESFLQAAHFVGRDAEIAQLLAALHIMLGGHGSGWLVGGESGVGKSRLLDEVRAAALVEGALVLRGQAVSNGRRSYQVWLNAFRWLVLLADPTDSEASVLKPLVQDIATLIGRPVADPPELDAQAAQVRLLSTITDLFTRQEQPLVLILEDLQWAGDEDLMLIRWLNRAITDHPILIIGNYRDDEITTLSNTLPDMSLIKLNRLSDVAIADLSASMLGSAGRREQVVELLQRETEGNVFFLIEVVRVLAEEAGQLEMIGSITLPKHILTGGIQQIVARRLKLVSDEARALLQIAAVLGRELDLTLLRILAPHINIEQWLDACSNAVILEVQQARWRFVHDKLREGLLIDLTADARADLHRRAALVIEAVYLDAPEQTASLAYHWAVAGDTHKERHYSALAGAQALNNGAYRDAKILLQRSLALTDSADNSAREQLERQLGSACMGLGLLGEASEHLQRVLTLARQPTASEPRQRFIQLAIELMRQAKHRIFGTRRVLPGQEARLLEMVHTYEQISVMYYWDSQRYAALYNGLAALNRAEQVAPSHERARLYTNMTIAAGLIPLHGLARLYIRLAKQTVAQLNDQQADLGTLRNTLVYAIGIGDFKQIEHETPHLKQIALRDRNYRLLGDCLANARHTAWYQRKVVEAAGFEDELYSAGKQADNIQLKIWALTYKAENALYQAQDGSAARYLSEAAYLYETSVSQVQPLYYQSVYMRLYLHRGEYALALQLADKIASHRTRSTPTVYAALYPQSSLPEALLMLSETFRDASSEQRILWKKQISGGIRNLSSYARVFPIGQPSLLLWSGLAKWLDGKPDQAIRNYKEAIRIAHKLNMPHEAGLAHYEWGRHLKPDDPARAEHLNAALDIFMPINAFYDIQRTKIALTAHA